MRKCGDCQLCCKLLPVEEIGKGANTRCRQQKHGKGCAVYGTSAMPASCSIWVCRWLANEDTADQPRPDRAHLVIDVMPDFVRARDPEQGDAIITIPVIQVWIDPAFPEAHRDPAFRRYLDRQGKPALIRYSARDGFLLIPPSACRDGVWIEKRSEIDPGVGVEKQHTVEEIARALGGTVQHEIADNGVFRSTLTVDGKPVEMATVPKAIRRIQI
jgi:hypothetical protein